MKTETPPLAAATTFSCDVCGARLDRAHLEFAHDGTHCTFCGAPQLLDQGNGDAMSSTSGTLDVGDALHDARMTRGETLEQAAHYTRIQTTYLRALEHDDAAAFEPFPGTTYARYFLRDYAEHLGIDAEPLVRRFDREVSAPVVEPVVRSSLFRRAPHPRRWAAGATALLIAALVAGTVWTNRAAPAGHASPGIAPPGRYLATGPIGPRGAVDLTATADHIWVTVRTIGAPSWVATTVDGSVVSQETMQPDSVRRWRADRTVSLRLGNAGATVVMVNGERVRTGAQGAVLDLAFALRNGTVVRI